MTQPPTSVSRAKHLDGIRGLAVFIVFLSHSAGRGLPASQYLELQGIGHIGVYLFFVLSSWLLTSIVLRELTGKGTVRLGAYFMRRFFRIAPLYFTVVTLVFFCQAITGDVNKTYLHVDGGVTGYLRHLSFLQGDSLFWTIPCEVSFYVALPLLAWALARWPRVAAPLQAMCAVGLSAWTYVLHHDPAAGWPLARLVDISHQTQFAEVFLIGMLGAWFAHRGNVLSRLAPRMLRLLEWTVALAAAGLLFYVCAITCQRFLWFERSDYVFRSHSWLFALVFTLVIYITEKLPFGLLARLFSTRLLGFMGVLGFSWYLLHFPIFQLLNEIRMGLNPTFPGANALFFVLAWVGCAGVSWLSFRLIELPGMAVGRRLEVVAERSA